MSVISIEKNISLEPKFLDKNIYNHIYQKIKTIYEGKCDQENGYITKIDQKFEILENVVSTASPCVFFKVRFYIKTFKPKIGDIFSGKIYMLTPKAVIINVMEKINVLISANNMNGYTYNQTTRKYEKGNKKIDNGSVISVKITNIKYEQHKFTCIGEMVP